MKKLLLLLVLFAWTASAQSSSDSEYMVFENVIITAHPSKIKDFEKNLAEHNKKYHSEGIYGCRVYSIMTGPNTGKYVWSMGPTTWSSMDNRPDLDEGHGDHWDTMVMPYVLPEANATYWRAYPEYSNLSKDFKLDKLDITYYDIKSGFGNLEKIKEILVKIAKMNKEKYPNDLFGVYINEFGSTKEGKDFVFVNFYNSFAKFGEYDDTWVAKYDEVNGPGNFERDVKTWGELIVGSERELWVLKPALCGLPPEVKAN